jgi:hypothetical protein
MDYVRRLRALVGSEPLLQLPMPEILEAVFSENHGVFRPPTWKPQSD